MVPTSNQGSLTAQAASFSDCLIPQTALSRTRSGIPHAPGVSSFNSDADAEAMLESLQDLGIVDTKGNFLTYKAVYKGEEKTVEDMKNLFMYGNYDSNEVAYIDGTPVTLGNLATMLLIEDELARIEETYFSSTGIPATEERMSYHNSLVSYVKSQGMALFSDLTPTLFPSGTNHDSLVKVRVEDNALFAQLTGTSSGPVKPVSFWFIQ